MNIPPSLQEIKAWRQAQHDAGKPSSFADFFRLNNICPNCRGRKIETVRIGVDAVLIPRKQEPCETCNGDGEYHRVA